MEIALPNRLQFGAFELDVRSGELASGRHRIVLQEQPLRVLLMLVGGTGELVTREEIQNKLWPNDTVVEFDASINAAVRKLRQALNDSAENPKYIETVARRGYRLMVPVEWPSPASGDSSAEISLQGISAPASPLDARPEEIHLALGTESSGAGSGEAVAAAPLRSAAFTGKKVSHYRVLGVLGGGGMGVVYEAEDLKLGRRVALKFLPEELAGDGRALERFEREARSASALNHPNICTIHEVEEHEGQPFIVMELLEGETLSKRIARAPLPLDETLDAAIQICAGLGAAHGKGIIHRDIKPSNIFITTEGVAKILDFGLAKLQEAGAKGQWPAEETGVAAQALPPAPGSVSPDLVSDRAPDLTLTGAAMGTVPYMSPEQVRGEKLDSRTDLFSFGAVLYEMTTVRQAFTGHSAAAIRDAILHQTPPPAGRANPASSPELQRIISKALEKDRELRSQSAEELRADLKGLKRSASSHSPSRRQAWGIGAGTAVLLAITAAIAWHFVMVKKAHALNATDTVVLADFTNATGDPVFDDTLKQALSISLRQSPFLELVSDSKVAATLKMMQRCGGERGPVTFPAFKAGDRALREPDGGFDSHTLPPNPTWHPAAATVGAYSSPMNQRT